MELRVDLDPPSLIMSIVNSERSTGKRRGRAAREHGPPSESRRVEGSSPWAFRWTVGWRSPFVVALVGGLLMWAALPPLRLWPLAWIAPVPWLILVRRERLGPRAYWAIWAASVVHWVLVMQGIRLAHWANYFGLLALSGYLGVYLPLFVAVTRQAVHRCRVPLVVAAPVAWMGIEVAHSYGPLGFSMALPAHTQTPLLAVIQISDLCGASTVSMLILLVAACLLSIAPAANRGWRVWPAFPLIAALTLTLAYGYYRLNQIPPAAGKQRPVRVALVQGAIDTVFEDNPNHAEHVMDQYSSLTVAALDRFGTLDLVMWPESMFPVYDVLLEVDGPPQLEPALDMQTVWDNKAAFEQLACNGIRRLNAERGSDGRRAHTSWLLGTTTWRFGDHPPHRLNAAIMIDPEAQVCGRYYKMHPVIFGEYVPFGERFPWLYRLTPMPNGLTSGQGPTAFQIAGLTLSPSICFENTMPHLIRHHVVQLTRQGRSPDVLVNLTNDGWFWGSTILDLQLDCAVFRSLELRRPFLIAANTGFSAWIDGCGRLLAKGPRRATDTLLAEVTCDGRRSLYEYWGDLPAGLCILFCLVAAVAGVMANRRATPDTPPTR